MNIKELELCESWEESYKMIQEKYKISKEKKAKSNYFNEEPPIEIVLECMMRSMTSRGHGLIKEENKE